MNLKLTLFCSIVIKFIIIISVTVGFTLSYLYGILKGVTCLLYFTMQSNIWIAIFDMVAMGFAIAYLIKKKYTLPNILYKFQQVFTICITITGIIYCFVLVPGFYASNTNAPDGFTPFTFRSVLLHIVVPVLAVLDYFLTVRKVKFRYVDSFYVMIPMLYYLGFSLLGYFQNWDFGEGRNFPYFFLNYDSPAGVFGFSDVMPYFMGSFYWIVILFVLCMGLSLLYIKIIMMIDFKALKKSVADSSFKF